MPDEEIDINKILANTVLMGAKEITKNTLDKIKSIWLSSTSRFGFTPSSDEANKLKKISENRTYIAFKSCIGSSPYNKFVKVGLLLYELMCEGKMERIKEIKNEIFNSKYGKYAVKIIHIASTGVLLNTLEYIVHIKDERNLSKFAISHEFEKIFELWSKVSIDVKNTDTQENVENNIINLMKSNPELMVVYASQTAIPMAQLAIANLTNKDYFRGKYLPWSQNLVHCDLEQFLCIFYKVEGQWETPFG